MRSAGVKPTLRRSSHDVAASVAEWKRRVERHARGELKDHPYANIFPLLDPTALDWLAEDIKTNGLMNSISLFESKILDGRNRFRACLKVGVEPHFVEFTGEDPLSFVISANAVRRDLTTSQRAAVAFNAQELVAKLKGEAKERMSDGGKGGAFLRDLSKGKTSEKLGRLFGVGSRYIEDALAIKELSNELSKLMVWPEPQWRQLAKDFSWLRELILGGTERRKKYQRCKAGA